MNLKTLLRQSEDTEDHCEESPHVFQAIADTVLREIGQYTHRKPADPLQRNMFQVLQSIEGQGRDIVGYVNKAFVVQCPTIESVDDLDHLCKSGDFNAKLQEAILTAELREKCEAKDITLCLNTDADDVTRCKETLDEITKKTWAEAINWIRAKRKDHIQEAANSVLGLL